MNSPLTPLGANANYGWKSVKRNIIKTVKLLNFTTTFIKKNKAKNRTKTKKATSVPPGMRLFMERDIFKSIQTSKL